MSLYGVIHTLRARSGSLGQRDCQAREPSRIVVIARHLHRPITKATGKQHG